MRIILPLLLVVSTATLSAQTHMLNSAPEATANETVSSPNSLHRYFTGQVPLKADSSASIISFGKLDAKQLEELAEDLNILRFLLDRNLQSALGKEAPDFKMGIPLLLHSGDRLVQGSYLEDFGVLFHMRVQFPLIAPANAKTNEAPVQTDSEWDRARRALYGAATRNNEMVRWNQATGIGSVGYDASLVTLLKEQALESLANAANLRHVPPDERIALVVSGSANVAEISTPSNGNYGEDDYGEPGQRSGHRDPTRRAIRNLSHSPARPTIMTIRVRKSAADDLAAKRISAERFAQQAEIHTYFDLTGRPEPESIPWLRNRF